MPNYTLEIEAYGLYDTDIPSLEIWADGALDSTHAISRTGSTISVIISYGGSLPTSLALTFNDALAEAGRTIEIQSVKINNRYVNTGNYLSSDNLSKTDSATLDIASSAFIFDNSDPDPSNFTPTTHTLTAGSDTYRNYDGTDHVLDGLAGGDRIYLGSGNDRVTGGAGNDRIFGGDGNDLLYGAEDNDRLDGQGGDDQLYGGTGNDRITGGDGNDEIHGGDGDDRLNGQADNDIITGGAGFDNLHGGDGDDYLFGDGDDDQLVGGNGADTLDGGDGDDIVYGNAGNDIIDGGDGADILIGNQGTDTINGGDGDDIILGGEDIDTIRGGGDSDTIYGGLDNDILHGDGGDDTIYGDLGELRAIMEANQISVTQTAPTQWHSISFSGIIDNPVIKLFAENVTGDPFTIRVQNVTNRGFEFQLDEYDYLDGTTGLENISWVAVASGTHTLASGHVVQAGYTTATDENTTAISFASSFATTPVVFTQLSSNNETDAVITRNSGVTTSGFDVMMHEQESNAIGHATEDIGWIAVSPGGAPAAGILAGTTGDVVTDTITSVNFGGPSTAPPLF